MWTKKFMTATAAGMLMAALVTSPALAHGHHRRAAVTAPSTSQSVSSYACTVEGCGLTGYHSHDGHNYWGCYSVCNVEGCGEIGHHTHDGHDYCGYGHSGGYCDGSCVTYSDSAGYCGGHHGCR